MAIKRIVDVFIENGFMISPESLNYLEKVDIKTREALIRSAIYRAKSLVKKPIVITEEFLRDLTGKNNKEEQEPKKKVGEKIIEKQKDNASKIIHQLKTEKKLSTEITPLSGKNWSECLAKNIEPIVEIDKDPTGSLSGSGKIKDVYKYFIDRYNKLKNLLIKRPDSKDSIPIESVKKYKDKIKVIGMVTDKDESEDRKRKGIFNYFLEIEDLTSSIRVFVPGSNELVAKIGNHIMLDQVICVEGILKDDIIIAENIHFPDVPQKSHYNKLEHPICAALLSDLHFGSKKFLGAKFDSFIEWVKGKIGSERQKDLAQKIKYILISGDLIDGVGVYPEHEKNLAIIDIIEQYELAAEYLNKIPEYITIIIIPGGAHDAVRKALPQECIPKNYAKSLYSLENTIMLGNPSFFKIHGMKTLMYHGEGLDDVIPSIPDMSYSKGDLAMIELLKARHLAPIYGNRVGISPEPYDWLVIDEVPDLFLCGHTHINRNSKYKGINIINSGTFQDETEYQQSLGIKPTPGIVPIVDLSDFSVRLKKF